MSRITRLLKNPMVFLLFMLALVLRSWTLSLVITLSLFVFLRYSKSKRKNENKLKMSEQQQEAIIANWKPVPLVPEDPLGFAPEPRAIEGKFVKYVNIDGKTCLNLASNDFLAFVGNQRIEEIAQKTISKYGVGACGPRNFYGTVDVHLDLERELAEFLGCEEAILYSYGFATIASAIPAYSKQGDIIFADKGVNFAIQKGLEASKSRIVWFDHNDMVHLEKLLEEQAEQDRKNPRKAAAIRRFMVVEGLYAKTATICQLPRLIELKWKYKVRIFMDESYSFGVLGQHGKGVTEHFGVDIIDVDLVSATLENAMATTGGFCAGRSFVIGHQRLSGLGYCFSASLPPLLATAASEALRIIQERPEMFGQLKTKSEHLHQLIQKAIEGSKFTLTGVELSPIKHIGYSHEDQSIVEDKLDSVVQMMYDSDIFITRTRYQEQEIFTPKPSLKFNCRLDLTQEEIENAVNKLTSVIRELELEGIS